MFRTALTIPFCGDIVRNCCTTIPGAGPAPNPFVPYDSAALEAAVLQRRNTHELDDALNASHRNTNFTVAIAGLLLLLTSGNAQTSRRLAAAAAAAAEEEAAAFKEYRGVQLGMLADEADFLTAGATVPTPKQIFGSDVEAKADGSAYKMVRFTKAGYWLSYNRTGGSTPMTSITLQKIQ